jgi:hypothetical protein
MARLDPDTLATLIADVFAKAFAPRDAHLRSLEQRLQALEVQPKGLNYAGAWQRASEYRRHEGATHKGQLWIVVVDATRAEPGRSGDWQLAAKDAP